MHEHEKGENLSDHQRRMCQRPAARTLKIQPGGTARRYGGQRFRMGSTPVALRQHAGVVQGIIRSDGPERRAHWVRFRLHDASGGGERRQRRTGYLKKIYTFRRTLLTEPRFYIAEWRCDIGAVTTRRNMPPYLKGREPEIIGPGMQVRILPAAPTKQRGIFTKAGRNEADGRDDMPDQANYCANVGM